MSIIRRVLSRCFLYVEKLKGSTSIREISSAADLRGAELEVDSITGYKIRIFCQTRRYLKQYSSPLIPSSIVVLYHAYSTVSQDAPAALQRACGLDITIPRPFCWLILDHDQLDTVLSWYLDLLIQRAEAIH